MSFIDTSDLTQFVAMVTEAADSPIDWYPVQGTDMHGELTYSVEPDSSLRAVVLDGQMELYNQQGYQRVKTRDFYFPGAPAIGPTDKVLLAGENPKSWTPTIRVEPLPTAGTTVATRVRTGRV